jgi:hypothetical protein
MPQLYDLRLKGGLKLLERYLEEVIPDPVPFSSFPNIKRLQLEDDIPFHIVPNPSEIEELIVITNSDYNMLEHIHYLSHFRSLKVLRLSVFGKTNTSVKIPTPIQLPALEQLDLYGSIPHNVLQGLSLDTLPSLTIDTKDAKIEDPEPICTATLFNVAEVVLFSHRFSESGKLDFDDDLYQDMIDLLPQLTVAHTLGVRSSLLEHAARQITRLRDEGRLQLLKTITTIDDQNQIIGPSYSVESLETIIIVL